MHLRLLLRLTVLTCLLAGVLTATTVTAEAAKRPGIIGHRCKDYAARENHENTIFALRQVSKTRGIWCEIDTMRGKDGFQFVWHDFSWTRVADPSTTQGIPRTVTQATKAHVRRVRTTGGDRVPSLKQFIKVAGRLNVNLLIEVKSGISTPRKWVKRADRAGIKVRWYQPLDSGRCTADKIGRLQAAGAIVGIKSSPACDVTPRWLAVRDFNFVLGPSSRLLHRSVVRSYRAAGVAPWVRGADESVWRGLKRAGVGRMIVANPRRAARVLW